MLKKSKIPLGINNLLFGNTGRFLSKSCYIGKIPAISLLHSVLNEEHHPTRHTNTATTIRKS